MAIPHNWPDLVRAWPIEAGSAYNLRRSIPGCCSPVSVKWVRMVGGKMSDLSVLDASSVIGVERRTSSSEGCERISVGGVVLLVRDRLSLGLGLRNDPVRAAPLRPELSFIHCHQQRRVSQYRHR